MAYGYDTVIKAGDGLKATTSGQSAHAAVAVNNDSAVGLNDDGPQITLGGNVQLATSGDEAYGLLAEGQGAFINVASGLDLKTTGL